MTDSLLISVRDFYGEMGPKKLVELLQEAVLPDGGKLDDDANDIYFCASGIRDELEKIFVYE